LTEEHQANHQHHQAGQKHLEDAEKDQPCFPVFVRWEHVTGRWGKSIGHGDSLYHKPVLSASQFELAPMPWDKNPQQQSHPVQLTSGQRYYIEARYTQGANGEYLGVAWQSPAQKQQVVGMQYLTPFILAHGIQVLNAPNRNASPNHGSGCNSGS
jgi:hypothetical protein